ncbi:hypothetical protein IVB14_07185 [Bradyrhizobium sp. 180]|uniref:hypothetical protein n=1 Tax=unclassified Bradyrhizobium TaxID=2631580 RepID=UPI001FF76BD0|nr:MULTISPECIES: hypothetical protein [unclassified Bradyrhizobium]MCK1490211.1 hypothetical protein [Bradyrhizobium sp. 180]MCK1528364.1 hypothetical protein [Bradyrhizobium sp. 182]MCK1649361.1 hypothetical protein [Bradyrhizobium sp. 154]
MLVPYLRGYGPTRFLSNETFRNGPTIGACDRPYRLHDALTIDKAILAGFDWGARSADIVAPFGPTASKHSPPFAGT